MRQFLSQFQSAWWRRLLLILLVLYFSLGLGLLAVRYLLAPHLNDWRPQIAAQLSHLSGTQASLGDIRLSWQGWNPRLEIQDLRLTDVSGQFKLAVPALKAYLDWMPSMLSGRLSLQVQGMDISLGRLADGRLHLLGYPLDSQTDTDQDALPGWLQWVLAQPLISFRDTTLRWHDQQAGTPELMLANVQAVLQQQGDQAVGLALSAQAPTAGDAALDVRLQVTDGQALAQGRLPAQWRAWLQLSHFSLPDWRAWLNVPDDLQQAMLTGQLWLQSGQETPRLTAQLDMAGLSWAFNPEEGVQVPAAAIWAQGRLDQWRALVLGQSLPQGLAFDVRAQGARLQQSAWFDLPLDIGEVALRGQLTRDEVWALQLQQLAWHNADIELQGQGHWTEQGVLGQLDFQGAIARAELNAIHRYLPREVDDDAREWLAKGLQAGTLRHGRWLLQGDLAEFPFGDHPQAGDFRVAGDFTGARIEFVPDGPASQVWPLLQDMDGTADLRRMDLQLTATRAQMLPMPDQPIRLWGLRARIPDMENDAILQVSGQTAADGAAYMALLRHSPIGALLDGVFDDAIATGDWQVPLSLTIPLNDTDASRVNGRVDIEKGRLQLLPQAPSFDAIHGSLHFNEDRVKLVQPLTAQLLGGAVSVSGELGDKTSAGLRFQGRLTAKALAKFIAVPGMQRIKGYLDYGARLSQRGRAYTFDLNSDTQGLALDFPAPLTKAADQARPLQLIWTDVDPQADQLHVQLGSEVRLDLQHLRKPRRGPYFQQALVGIGQAADGADAGLRVALHYPLIDLDRWNLIVDEFSIPRRNQGSTTKQGQRPLWPDLSLLSVQADQLRLMGTRLDRAVMRVVRTPDEHWSLNLRSEQTTGTLKWQERDGQVIGNMAGKFARLSLGDDAADTTSLLPDAQLDEAAAFDDELNLPGVVLQADELRLYGHPVGALSLEGVRDAAQHIWRLDQLVIGDADARLKGTGLWQLRGAGRGLSLKANVAIKNLGAWMTRAGYPDVLSGGAGTLTGNLRWLDLPWRRDKAALQGSLQFSLDEGRFQKVGSRTAKLLEILSLQSIMRLTHLEHSLESLPKDGFPFDQLRGALDLKQGVVHARDYKVIGPVGTILLEGSTNILHETLDLQAVIVPSLDVSGAALAAGIAINPLVGLGAFVTQWLLKAPLAKAMTVRYHVTGTWDEPVIRDVPVSAAAASSDAGSSRSPKSP
ncbi:YhdP family protein [Castellaniella sp.]|uniref:YhdP family protein n=1 Tax=Castellaniella sp. TaxID=1955812 RepID=UPI002AFDDF6F|nr:YhdP family protein [Castellaniella sp.]